MKLKLFSASYRKVRWIGLKAKIRKSFRKVKIRLKTKLRAIKLTVELIYKYPNAWERRLKIEEIKALQKEKHQLFESISKDLTFYIMLLLFYTKSTVSGARAENEDLKARIYDTKKILCETLRALETLDAHIPTTLRERLDANPEDFKTMADYLEYVERLEKEREKVMESIM